MPKFHVHARVSWLCRPKEGKPFVCKGEIVKIKPVLFGGKLKAVGALVKVSSKAYLQTHKRKTALIRTSRLTLVA
ncbi:MAG: hypothetical protein WCV84_04545 [Patescibacteria group bacterium]